MPLIDVTYDATVGEEVLHRLGELLPEVAGEAVECPKEPSAGPAEPEHRRRPNRCLAQQIRWRRTATRIAATMLLLIAAVTWPRSLPPVECGPGC